MPSGSQVRGRRISILEVSGPSAAKMAALHTLKLFGFGNQLIYDGVHALRALIGRQLPV